MELVELAVAHLNTVAAEVQKLKAEVARLEAILDEGSKLVKSQENAE